LHGKNRKIVENSLILEKEQIFEEKHFDFKNWLFFV